MCPAMATLLDHTLELRPETAERLRVVAALVAGDPMLIAHEGIERILDDIEDVRLVEERLRDYVPGSGVTLDSLIAKYGIDDEMIAQCALDD